VNFFFSSNGSQAAAVVLRPDPLIFGVWSRISAGVNVLVPHFLVRSVAVGPFSLGVFSFLFACAGFFSKDLMSGSVV